MLIKKAILCLLTCLPAALFAQDAGYVVDGTLGAYNAPAKVYLQFRDKYKVTIDSVVLINGKFRFEGKIANDPIMATLMFNAKGTGLSYSDTRQVYLENGTATINSSDQLSTATIIGTPTNVDNAKLASLRKGLDSFYDRLNNKRNSTSDEEKNSDSYKKDLDKLEKDLMAQEGAIDKKFIQDNPDSYISIVLLGGLAYSADYGEIAPLFDGLSGRIKQTVRGKHFEELLPHIKAVALGSVAPDFTEADTAGKMVALSSFRGKYVLIDFWASWCGPCRQENPNVIKAFNRYKSQNFTIVGVSLDSPDGRDRWLAAIHKDGLAWTQLSDLKYWDSEVAARFAVKAIPQNFLLDPNGKIIAKNLRGDDLENKLEEIFGKI